ncbi:MAG: ATP-binding protein [Lactobacillaceae bacterium]|nr:ATP-binding protein [Lactobacillaceae bacterium]
MIKRELESSLKRLQKTMPVLAVIGPRQSGKTTLIREVFPDYEYFNLEKQEDIDLISKNPENFFKNHSRNVILDEVQKMPELLSRIMITVDETRALGSFVISGSENLLLSEKISQSLAGRVGYVTLLPTSLKERSLDLDDDYFSDSIMDNLFKGGYPAVYQNNVIPSEYYSNYISTYIERDVRQVLNIKDLVSFRKLLVLLANSVGSEVNYATLSKQVGISTKTIQNWLSILEATYIIFRLQPYFDNFGKRIVKSPKIFFYDTGILLYLLGYSMDDLGRDTTLYGHVFENLVITEVIKNLTNLNIQPDVYFFKASSQDEVDLIIGHGFRQTLIEIKSANIVNRNFFKGLNYYQAVAAAKHDVSRQFLIYNGQRENVSGRQLLNWQEIDEVTDYYDSQN